MHTGLLLECRIHFHETIIDRPLFLTEDKFDDAISLIHRIEQGAVALFADTDGLLRGFPLRNIASNFRCPNDPASGVADRRYRKGNVKQYAVLAATNGFVVVDGLSIAHLSQYAR